MDVYARFFNKESFMKDFIGVLKLELWQTFLVNVVHFCFFLLIIRIIKDNMLLTIFFSAFNHKFWGGYQT